MPLDRAIGTSIVGTGWNPFDGKGRWSLGHTQLLSFRAPSTPEGLTIRIQGTLSLRLKTLKLFAFSPMDNRRENGVLNKAQKQKCLSY